MDAAGFFNPKSAEQREADREDIRWTNITLAEINRGELTPPLKAELRSNRSGKYTYRATKLSYSGTLNARLSRRRSRRYAFRPAQTAS